MLRAALILLFSRTGILRLVYRLLMDRRVPFRLKLIIPAAILYLISPLDFIPDIVPVSGWIDDLLVVLLSLMFFLVRSPKEAVSDHLNNPASRKRREKVIDGSYRVLDDEEGQ